MVTKVKVVLISMNARSKISVRETQNAKIVKEVTAATVLSVLEGGFVRILTNVTAQPVVMLMLCV